MKKQSHAWLVAPWVWGLGLLIGMPAIAQQPASDIGRAPPSLVAANFRPIAIKAVTVYLHHTDGQWSASLSGDVKDPATEKIEILLAGNSLRVMTRPQRDGSRLCMTKMKDRAEFGYLECNSAFYSSNKGSAAVGTLVRGVMSLGILTVTDAASGSTGFTVSLDQQALDAAVAESKAIELAQESAPLIEYREAFSRAISLRELRGFIATYDGVFDPESLVAMAKEKLPQAIEQEEIRTRQKAEAAAQRIAAERQQEIQQQAESDALRQFQAKIRPGDRIKVIGDRNISYFGMVIEVKPPLAYIQWENVTPPLQWLRLDMLLPTSR